MKKNIVFILMVIAVVSCDILSTRNPEEPEKSGVNFIPATEPKILFDNLKESFEKTLTENYMSCFVNQDYLKKDFVFYPASGSAIQNPVLNSWSLESEETYFNSLKSKLSSNGKAQLTFSKLEGTPLGDSAIYEADYSIVISSSNTILNGNYTGAGRFKIYRDSRQQWVIAEWQDIKKENFLCWSDLKGRTY